MRLIVAVFISTGIAESALAESGVALRSQLEAYRNPHADTLKQDRTEMVQAYRARFFWQRMERIWGASFHLLGDYRSGTASTNGLASMLLKTTIQPNRASVLQRRWHETSGSLGSVLVDRALVSADARYAKLSLGRQPLALSGMSLFQVNDLFSPFPLEEDERRYKPGVDAAVLNVLAGLSSQVQLISVAGYREASELENEWSPDHASHLLQYQLGLGRFDWRLLAGNYQRERFFGLWGSAELPKLWVLMVEGHNRQDLDESPRTTNNIAFGLKRYFPPAVQLNVEYLFQEENVLYDLGERQYSTAKIGYDWSEKWHVSLLQIQNLIDGSSRWRTQTQLRWHEDHTWTLELYSGTGGWDTEFGATPRGGRLQWVLVL